MPAREKIGLNQASPIQKLGIIAGGGSLPLELRERCRDLGIQPHIIGLIGSYVHSDADLYCRIGSAGKVLRYLRFHQIQDIVFTGAVKRPSLVDFCMDWTAIKFLLKLGLRLGGDNNLLTRVRAEVEKNGFRFHGVQEFLSELLMPEGVLGQYAPAEKFRADIQIGLNASQQHGEADLGQSVIVKEGEVIGREGKDGTNALIQRFGCEGAILVKTCKPQQDKDLDLPALGSETVMLCANKKMAGIVGQAHNTLLIDALKTISIADQNGLFLLGVSLHA